MNSTFDFTANLLDEESELVLGQWAYNGLTMYTLKNGTLLNLTLPNVDQIESFYSDLDKTDVSYSVVFNSMPEYGSYVRQNNP